MILCMYRGAGIEYTPHLMVALHTLYYHGNANTYDSLMGHAELVIISGTAALLADT